jgi:DNA processing protein
MQAEKEMSSQSRDRELLACLTLFNCRYLGARTWKELVRAYGSPARAISSGWEEWLSRSLVNKRQVRSLKDGSAKRDAARDAEIIAKKGYKTIIWTDSEYPELLRNIPDPPLLFYYRGDISLLSRTCLAAVGSRKCSVYGVEMAKSICSELSENNICIVSGFASGIDREAHLAGLSGPGSSIAVLGTGIDLIYPARNRDLWSQLVQKGLVLTEFPPGTEPDGYNFPHRNRIIAGMSNGVLVLQGEMKSGSLITASLALDQGREVFAVPGGVNMPGYEGCNQLIRDGAYLVRSARDILEVVGSDLHAPDRHSLSANNMRLSELEVDEDEAGIMELLFPGDELHIDTITRKTGWSSSEVSRILTGLEIKGFVRKSPGMYYSVSV